MKKTLAAVAVMLIVTAPRLMGATALGLGFPLFSTEVEYYTRPSAGGAFLEASHGDTRGLGFDPGGKHVVPWGMDLTINIPHARGWLVRVDQGKSVVSAVLAETDCGRLVWPAEAIRQYHEANKIDPGGILPLVVISLVVDSRNRKETIKLLGLLPIGRDSTWSNENRPTTLAIQFDNWCGWRCGQPWREPPERFWQDRLTWNRATEVSDLVPSGQQAGTENWTSKWANQLGPGNSVLARVRFEDGTGKSVDPRGQIGLFFLTKRERQVPFSLPGSLVELYKLPVDWHALPAELRATIKDLGLQPWVLVWQGDPRAATFVVPLALRQAVATSFPLQPGMRRLVLVGADGFEASNGLPMSYGTDDAGDDTRVLVPAGQGGANLPRLWLNLRGFPTGELTEEVESTPIAPATRQPEAVPATPPEEAPQRLE